MREGMPLRDGMSAEHHQTALGESEVRPRLRAALLDALADRDLQTLDGGGLAARAGLPETAFAAHYRDVDDCFLDAYDELTRDLRADFVQRMEEASGDWHDRLTCAIDTGIDELFSTPGAVRLLFLEAARSPDPVLQEHRAAARERFVEVVTDPSARGESPDVPVLHVEFLVAALAHAAHDELVAGGDCASAGRRVRELLAVFEPIAA